MTLGYLAYHIQASRRTIEPFRYKFGKDLAKRLDCNMLASGGYVGGRNMLTVDDEGLWKPARHFWRLVGSFEPVPHDAILVGPDTMDAKGREHPTDPTISIEALRALVEWVSRAEYEAWIDAHRDQPAIEVNGNCVQTWGELYAEMPKLVD